MSDVRLRTSQKSETKRQREIEQRIVERKNEDLFFSTKESELQVRVRIYIRVFLSQAETPKGFIIYV